MEEVKEDGNLDFKWLKKRGVGGKNKLTRFYESFIFDGVEYMLYDCVYMYMEGLPQPFIGKLTKIWAHPDKPKKVKVHWFFLPEEVSHWLGETKTLENEVFFASGEGRGLADVNPLEAIAGKCNVVCVSKDSRNPQPSDEELKAADFIFYRTFDVQSCTISDKMDDKVGGLEIEYIFNRKEGEKSMPAPGTSDTKDKTPNTIISNETQEILTKTVLKEDAKKDPKENDIPNLLKRNSESDKSHDRPTKRIKPDDKCVESGVASGSEKLTELPSMKSKADKDKMQVIIVPAEKVENKERNKTPTGSDKSHDQPSKKTKSDDKKPPPEEKNIQPKVAQSTGSDKSHDQPSKKTKSDDKKPLPEEKNIQPKVAQPTGSDKSHDQPMKKTKSDDKKPPPEEKTVQPKVAQPTDSDNSHDQPLKKTKSDDKKPPPEGKTIQPKVAQSTADSKSKHDDKLPADANNLKTSGTSDTTENQKNGKISGKVTDDLEGKQLKRKKDDGSFKVPDNSTTWTCMNEPDKAANSALSQEKSKCGILDSPGDTNNMEAKEEEQSDEKKNKLLMNNPWKASPLSTDEAKKNKYREFVITRKPNAESSNWWRRLHEEKLKNAYDQGRAILLLNLKPDYTSEDVEDIIWHAFSEKCDAKILQRTAVSSPHYDQAIILLKSKEAAQRILTELDEECLLSDERPLVATPCPPISTKKNLTFFGHLAVDKARFQNQREDVAVSTSHFSQPNTIEYDMAMEWCLQQLKSDKWWTKLHKKHGVELKIFKKDLK